MNAAARDEVVLFVHSTGTGPLMWSSVPDAALGGREKLFPSNVGYPPGELVPRGRRLGSTEDAAAVLAAVPDGSSPVHVVAHSYGALVALRVIRELGDRVASVFFYEPVTYSVLRGTAVDAAAAAELKRFVDEPWFLEDEERGGRTEWQEAFIDYWNKPGSWSRMPDGLREMSLALGWKMFQEVRAVFHEEAPTEGWSLSMPTTVAIGERTTAMSRAMTKALAAGRPNVSVVEMPGLGHMAPLTHSARVHEEIARHFARVGEVTR